MKIFVIAEDTESIRAAPFAPETAAERGRVIAPFVGFALFSLTISLAFFWAGRGADLSALIGDQINILTICIKKDHPQLFAGDEVISDVKNVDYYTPVFISALRALALPDRDYVRGLNVMLLLTSLLYMWGWWLLFSVWGERLVAAVLAFLMRCVMYPPGFELWGIAGLWTMLPRTLFLALLPFVLWGWLRGRGTKWGWPAVCLGCGLLANIHPISGAAVAVALALAECYWTLAETKSLKAAATKVLSGAAAMLVGMAPFVWTYLTKLGDTAGVNPAEFEQALRLRIGPLFWDPILYLGLWLRPKWAALVLLPWAAFLFFPRRIVAGHKRMVVALAFFFAGCVLTALLPFLVEWGLKRLGYQARFAFQLVRTGKYVLVPTFVLAAMLCSLAARHLAQRLKYGRATVAGLCCLVVLLTIFARHPVFDGVPVLGDDAARMLWPERLVPQSEFDEDGAETVSLAPTLDWLRENTAEDAKFLGPRRITVGARRAVVHDWKSAVLLIEGSPAAFVEAARKELALRSPEYRDPIRRSQLFVSWGADYWVTKKVVPALPLSYASSGWFVYDLRSLPRER